MVKEKYWVRKKSIGLAIVYYVCLLVIIYITLLPIGLQVASETKPQFVIEGVTADDKKWRAFLFSLLFSLKWTSIVVLPLATIVLTVYIVKNTSYVVFASECIYFYQRFFTKEGLVIEYNAGLNCLINPGLWSRRSHGKRTIKGYALLVFDGDSLIGKWDIDASLSFALYKKLGEKRLKVVGENLHKKTLSNYFSVDFPSLTEEEQFCLFRYYCGKWDPREIDGEKYLKKKLKSKQV